MTEPAGLRIVPPGNHTILHVRGALNNGLTKEELLELFLQSAAYCGMPAALDAMRVAQEVFADLESGTGIGDRS